MFLYLIKKPDDLFFPYQAFGSIGCSQVKIGKEVYFFITGYFHLIRVCFFAASIAINHRILFQVFPSSLRYTSISRQYEVHYFARQ